MTNPRINPAPVPMFPPRVPLAHGGLVQHYARGGTADDDDDDDDGTTIDIDNGKIISDGLKSRTGSFPLLPNIAGGLSLPSYAASNAINTAGQQLQQQIRQQQQKQKDQKDPNDPANLIGQVGDLAKGLAPLATLALLQRGGLVKLQDGGTDDEEHEPTGLPKQADDDDDDDQEPTGLPKQAGEQDDETTEGDEEVGPQGNAAGIGLSQAIRPGVHEIPGGLQGLPPGHPLASPPDAFTPGGFGGAGSRGGTRTIPGLGPAPLSRAQQIGDMLLSLSAGFGGRSPYFGVNFSQAMQNALAQTQAQRKQDQLDQKPQMIDDGTTIKYRVGNKVIDTGLRSPRAATLGAQESRFTRHEQTLRDIAAEREKTRRAYYEGIATRAGMPSKTQPGLNERARNREMAQLYNGIIRNNPRLATNPEEAARQAREAYRHLHPEEAQPAAPAAPVAPATQKPPAASADTDKRLDQARAQLKQYPNARARIEEKLRELGIDPARL